MADSQQINWASSRSTTSLDEENFVLTMSHSPDYFKLSAFGNFNGSVVPPARSKEQLMSMIKNLP